MLIERSKAKQGIDEKRVTSLATKGGRKGFPFGQEAPDKIRSQDCYRSQLW